MRTEEKEKDVEDISGEVRTGLRKLKKGKALGPDDIPVEAWIALGNKGVGFLVNFFNRLLGGEKMNRRDGVVMRASASQSVDLGFIS